MRKQNHPIELFIATNFILMKSTRFHYSGLGHNLCYKETSAVTKFAIMRSTHWRIPGRGGCVCAGWVQGQAGRSRGLLNSLLKSPTESKCLEIIHTLHPHRARMHTCAHTLIAYVILSNVCGVETSSLLIAQQRGTRYNHGAHYLVL